MAMRVVAGAARGRRIDAPDGRATRPTGDRVRESIFNALGSLDAVVNSQVLDLFAGSGALGIEALSRGAAHCTFVDHDRSAIVAVRANLDRLGLAERATVVQQHADRYLADAPLVDLAFLDPPYAFGQWTWLLEAVPANMVVMESNRSVQVEPGWKGVRERSYGTTVVAFARRVPHGTE